MLFRNLIRGVRPVGKPKHTAKKHYMTLDEAREVLDDLARERNAVAQHNERVETGDLIEYAERAGINWKAPGGLEAARKLRNEDAARGRKLVEGAGRPFKVPPEDLCAAVADGHDRYSEKSWNQICEEVAAEHRVSKQTVLDHTRAISWGKTV